MPPQITCRAVLDFLADRQLLASPVTASASLDQVVTGVARDSAARPGDMSWISPRRLGEISDIVASFGGTLLICPVTDRPFATDALIAPCKNPKVAFSIVVDRFFPELTSTTWPSEPVASDARIGARVRLAPGVCLGPGVTLGDDVSIGPNSCLANAFVGDRTTIGANCSIGLPGFGYEKAESGDYVRFPHLGRVVIGRDVSIGSNTCIDRGALDDTEIGEGAKIDNLVHIAHNVRVGAHSLVIAHAMIGGSVTIGDDAWVAPCVAVKNQVRIGANALLGMGAVVLRDVPDGTTVVGNPAKPLPRK